MAWLLLFSGHWLEAEVMGMAQQRQWQQLDWQDPFLLEQQLSDEQRAKLPKAKSAAN